MRKTVTFIDDTKPSLKESRSSLSDNFLASPIQSITSEPQTPIPPPVENVIEKTPTTSIVDYKRSRGKRTLYDDTGWFIYELKP